MYVYDYIITVVRLDYCFEGFVREREAHGGPNLPETRAAQEQVHININNLKARLLERNITYFNCFLFQKSTYT